MYSFRRVILLNIFMLLLSMISLCSIVSAVMSNSSHSTGFELMNSPKVIVAQFAMAHFITA